MKQNNSITPEGWVLNIVQI